jgi:hypothetical protein
MIRFDWRIRRLRASVVVGLALTSVSGGAVGQAAPPGPVIDTIVIVSDEPFDAEAAASSGVFRGMNAIHITTRPWVIRRELLFKAGEPFDPLMLEETERNLRSLGIFSDVTIDTIRIDGKLAAVVRTQDGWSPTPKISFSAATDGTVTTTLGASDANFLGTIQSVPRHARPGEWRLREL